MNDKPWSDFWLLHKQHPVKECSRFRFIFWNQSHTVQRECMKEHTRALIGIGLHRLNSHTLTRTHACTHITHRHTHTPEWKDPSCSLKVPAGQLLECDIFISVENQAVNLKLPAIICTWSDCTANTRFITVEGGGIYFWKAVNQPLLNEQHGSGLEFVSQVVVCSLFHFWLPTSSTCFLLLIMMNVPSLLPAPSSYTPLSITPVCFLLVHPILPSFPFPLIQLHLETQTDGKHLQLCRWMSYY